MTAKLTPWFSAKENPWRNGEYEYKYSRGYKFRAYWNGYLWEIRDKSYPESWGDMVGDWAKSGHWRGRIKP